MATNPIMVRLGTFGDICRQFLEPVDDIRLLYVRREEPNLAFVLVVLRQKDFSVERQIYAKQLEIMEKCPDVKFDLRVVSLRGRKLSDVVVPEGLLLLERSMNDLETDEPHAETDMIGTERDVIGREAAAS